MYYFVFLSLVNVSQTGATFLMMQSLTDSRGLSSVVITKADPPVLLFTSLYTSHQRECSNLHVQPYTVPLSDWPKFPGQLTLLVEIPDLINLF